VSATRTLSFGNAIFRRRSSSHWKKRLRQAATGQFVEMQVARTEKPPQLTAAHSQAIEIRLSGRCVFVDPGFDADHLRAVLAALETRV
jgi:hypothetical protein